MFQPYWDCDFWCGVALVYLFTYAFIWAPGLLSVFTGYICGALMPRIQRPTGFRVGVWTAIGIVGFLAVWTVLYATYPDGFFGDVVIGVVLALHVLSILVPIIACGYIHTRRRKWWDLRPRKQADQGTHSSWRPRSSLKQ